MKKIISDIHNAVQNSRKTVEFLKLNSSWKWQENYPIAIIHEKTRLKDAALLESLERINFFDTDGFSKECYTDEELKKLQEQTPQLLKSAYALCLKKEPCEQLCFSPKFMHDKWKKVNDDGNFVALVEFSKFDENANSKTIETELRDIMRSAKEIPSLKACGFVWIVNLPKSTNMKDILNHYFLDNHIYVQKGRKVSYIAWSEKLANINMRYFVNTP